MPPPAQWWRMMPCPGSSSVPLHCAVQQRHARSEMFKFVRGPRACAIKGRLSWSPRRSNPISHPAAGWNWRTSSTARCLWCRFGPWRLELMPRYFFNFVRDGSPQPDLVGRDLTDDPPRRSRPPGWRRHQNERRREGTWPSYDWEEVINEEERAVARFPVLTSLTTQQILTLTAAGRSLEPRL